MPTRPAERASSIGIVQALVGQLHDDDEFAVHNLDAIHREDEGMADLLHAVQRVQFLFGAGAIDVEGVEVAENELDGLEQAAGRLAFPCLAKAAAAQRLDESIPGDRFRVGLPNEAHVVPCPLA